MNRVSSLRSVLFDLPDDRPLWSTVNDEIIRVSDIKHWLTESSHAFAIARNRNVAVEAIDDRSFALSLVLLDGLANQITMLPRSVSPERKQSILKHSQSELILELPTETIDDTSGALWPLKPASFLFRCLGDGCDDHHATPSEVFTSESGNANASASTTRWIMTTSGTTGVPKLVSHTFDSLTRSCRRGDSCGETFRWGSLYSLGSFAGLQVFLQSWVAGSRLLFSDDHEGLAKQLTDFARRGCNALSATPTLWRLILMSQESASLPLRQITLGGEIVDQPLLDALQARYPGARITHIYASTEAGVGFAVNDGRAGFPISYLDACPGNVELQIDHDHHLLLRHAKFQQRYVNERADEPLSGDDGFIDSGDIVQLIDDRIQFRGRANGTINVGGLKVMPQEIELTLQAMPEVSLARVYAKKNPFSGSVVAAEIVASEEHKFPPKDLSARALRWCRTRLDRHKIPALIDVVDHIAITDTGKIVR
ncbi:class I adenylate-forming enzyme family protein [Roseiconus lacunae]|uniref:Class I adenylate-forming enzyme family protein n=1 Tax=Roseiconus lacunae TaxID=2605694 RepID=A0ABT7PDJ4_9BACT|nr:class I adenylate-forming enzyme family protein [Roseiconus lacunae]MDM4014552.1 class I adenylate-forming enzyme family protein [Roseiconus lacunae]